jgi:diguanylate cyclase (GGDEF)-like protein
VDQTREDRRALRVLTFAGVLTTAGMGMWLTTRGVAAPPSGPEIPWLALVVGFLVAECCVVHLELRGDAQSFCLSELPLVIGLLCVPADELVTARLVGGFIVIALVQRQMLLKIAFNLALMLFWASLALFVFHHTSRIQGLPVPAEYVGTFAAVVAVAVADGLAIALVVRLSGGTSKLGAIRRMLLVCTLGALATASLALLAVTATATEPAAALLVPFVSVLLYLAYRSYAGIQQRYDKLQQLYEFTQILSRAPEFSTAAHAILVEARELMHSERAELYLPTGDTGSVVRVSLLPSGAVESDCIAVAQAGPWRHLLGTGQTVLVGRAARDDERQEWLRHHGAKDLILAPLVQGGTIVGGVAVLDRLGSVSTFDAEDVKVFGTFANHASMSLQNTRLIHELRREAADKERQALHDALTGLGNRTMLYRRGEEAIARATETSGRVGLLLMDLDRFKEINDTLGHHHGDLLLRQLAERLLQAVPDGATVARLGGDEFAILIPCLAAPAVAWRTGERISARVFKEPFRLGDLELTVSGSVGVAVSPDHGTATDVLLQRADVAMYAAKNSDRGSVELYQAEQDEHSAHRLALAGALRHAIDHRELTVAYQPKAELATGRVVGVEALARWHHPEFGHVPPDQFVPLAEHLGLIRPLTTLMLESALLQLGVWRRQGIDISVAVNLSVRNLVDGGLPRDLLTLLGRHGIEPSLLTLEITESEIMRDTERTMAILNRLRAIGVHLAIDDFGTGHSSLAYLRELPVDEIKIDKSFIFELATSTMDASIVRSIVDLARTRDLRVVAEGVEDRLTWELLDEIGCHVAQGYYLARPLPADDLTPWLLEQTGEHLSPQA